MSVEAGDGAKPAKWGDERLIAFFSFRAGHGELGRRSWRRRPGACRSLLFVALGRLRHKASAAAALLAGRAWAAAAGAAALSLSQVAGLR